MIDSGGMMTLTGTVRDVASDGWREDLEKWLAPFLAELTHPAQRRMCPTYIAGLIGPGDRKSIQPLAARTEDAGYDGPPIQWTPPCPYGLSKGVH